MRHPVDPSRGPSRRDVLALGAGAFVVALLPIAARRRGRLVRRTLPVMGTIADLAVVHTDERAAQAALDEAWRELERVEGLMTRFEATSDVGRLNASGGGVVAVGEDTATVLTESLRWAAATEGAFDPCLGQAVGLWDVGRRHEPPPPGALVRWAGRGLWRDLDVDRQRGCPVARLGNEDASVDLGGIAKGYAVDLAVRALRRRGIAHALVNVGGDLFALGSSEDGDPWRVGIRDPQDPHGLLGSIDVRDEAVATSGDYEHGFDSAGRRYHHLLDPRTAEPLQTQVHGVTVVASTCLDADAGATAAFVLGPAAAGPVLRRAAPDARVVSGA